MRHSEDPEGLSVERSAKHRYERLDWDSDFFSFEVARIDGPLDNGSDVDHVVKMIVEQGSRLCYYATPEKPDEAMLRNSRVEFVPVDRKVTFVKRLGTDTAISSSLSSAGISAMDSTLIDLAIQSGTHSRFNKDERISTERYETLYRLWMSKSLERQLAREVLVCRERDESIGVITIGAKNGQAQIGIFAVDRLHRDRGIGKALLSGAEAWAVNHGYRSMRIVTQADNTAACNLYAACDYAMTSLEYFYHIWRI